MTQAQLGAQTSAEIADRESLVLVPLGATEQHGPHLPLDTDTRIAVALVEELLSSSISRILSCEPSISPSP